MVSIKGNTSLLGVIGHPISHSASPAMHNNMIEKLNLNYVYVPINVNPDSLQDTVKGLKSMNFSGFNVTVPFKESIIDMLDKIDAQAAQIGAVNTVVNYDGQWVGYNTDGDGFVYSVKHHTNFAFSNKKVAIIGAGGTTRSIVASLLKENIYHLSLVNRTVSNAEKLVQDFTHLFDGLDVDIYSTTDNMLNEQLRHADIVVNTTPLGMKPYEHDLPLLSTEWMRGEQLCYDVIYNPNQTLFLKEALKKGCTIMNGMGMLASQAALAFKYFTGHDADYDLMYESVKNYVTS